MIIDLPDFFITFIKEMVGSSHSQLLKKNSCSVKLQDHNPRKIPVKDFIFNKFIILFHLLTCTIYIYIYIYINNDFGYIRSNSCYIEQLLMSVFEYPKKCDMKYCSNCQRKYYRKNNKKKTNTQKSKEKKFEGKVREKGWVILIFGYLYWHSVLSGTKTCW